MQAHATNRVCLQALHAVCLSRKARMHAWTVHDGHDRVSRIHIQASAHCLYSFMTPFFTAQDDIRATLPTPQWINSLLLLCRLQYSKHAWRKDIHIAIPRVPIRLLLSPAVSQQHAAGIPTQGIACAMTWDGMCNTTCAYMLA